MKPELNKENSLLLVIDIQENFRKVIHEFNRVVDNSKKLIKAFEIFNIPIIVTEQYPKGLGETVSEIKGGLKEYSYVEKLSFDCFNDDKFLEVIKEKEAINLIICGIESHICVFQSVMSALKEGYNVYLVADAVSSRKKGDYDIALKRMMQEGAKLVSIEMIIFQMMKDSKDENFKEISGIVK
jgi:nicotinamidase-related amidase